MLYVVFILLYDWYWLGGVLKLRKNDHFFSIFSRLCVFPQVFGQLNEWSALEFYEMIRVLHVVVSQLFSFFLMIEIGRETGVRIYEEWSFFYNSHSFRFFPKFLGRLWVAYIRIAWNSKGATSSCLPNYFYFVWWLRGVLKLMKNYNFSAFLTVWVLFSKFVGR